MIADFIASWPLFADCWLSSWVMAMLLALVGVVLLARNQVFLGAAMSQTATAGVALFLCVAAGHATSLVLLEPILAIVGAIVAALIGSSRHQRDSVVGWLFCAASSAAVLLVAHSPHGSDEVNRLMASSLIGATRTDFFVLVGMLAIVVIVIARAGDRLKTLLLDEPFAAAIGIPIRRWNLAIALGLGTSIGWSLHVAGLLFVVGALVLPGMAARLVCREFGHMTLLAPALALIATMIASLLANAWDLPPAQVAVALMAALVPAAAGVKKLREWAE